MIRKILLAFAASLVLSPAHAVLTFHLIESGGNVTLTATGSVNTAALVPTFPGACGAGTGLVNPSAAQFCTGAGVAIRHAGLTGPASFGPGGLLQGTGSSTGDNVYMVGVLGELYLPVGYVSGAPLSGASQFPGTTLAAMGVTPGTYTWTFGAGQTVTQLWNGTVTQAGDRVSVANAPYNAAIPTGASVSFGFNGAWNGTNPSPASFALNGTACTGAVGSPSASTSPSASIL